jgi:molybdopterin synthase sulfur carrier subunit
MRVLIPSALHSYSSQAWVEAEGATVAAVLADLERRYPGIRFRMIDEQERIRPHIRFFAQRQMVFDLTTPLAADGEFLIVQALSGG